MMNVPYAARNAQHVDLIQQALNIPDFDSHMAKLSMGMAGRLVDRPADKPGRARTGAVMLLLYPVDDVLHALYTKRPDSLRDHSGQISFPGGRVDEGETKEEAALRELWEEVGIVADDVTVLGRMSQLYIMPSDFMVHPFVGYVANRPNFTINPDEVETLLEVPLPLLLDPATRREEKWTFERFGGMKLNVPYYLVDEHKIWGATAIMTGEFLERWKVILRDA